MVASQTFLLPSSWSSPRRPLCAGLGWASCTADLLCDGSNDNEMILVATDPIRGRTRIVATTTTMSSQCSEMAIKMHSPGVIEKGHKSSLINLCVVHARAEDRNSDSSRKCMLYIHNIKRYMYTRPLETIFYVHFEVGTWAGGRQAKQRVSNIWQPWDCCFIIFFIVLLNARPIKSIFNVDHREWWSLNESIWISNGSYKSEKGSSPGIFMRG